ncbi:hypothetical protein AVEN_181142-1 [Araneus ventricosus]|uniref:Uncharacterized protein n=1 Tax=Araneus ventricosus TaxID=182803 RepID=A0A4Y2KN77_ARAVE|nr:hypothetical protein AVEN_181142-1 [Araneus ventricosus]
MIGQIASKEVRTSKTFNRRPDCTIFVITEDPALREPDVTCRPRDTKVCLANELVKCEDHFLLCLSLFILPMKLSAWLQNKRLPNKPCPAIATQDSDLPRGEQQKRSPSQQVLTPRCRSVNYGFDQKCCVGIYLRFHRGLTPFGKRGDARKMNCPSCRFL